MKNRGSSAQFEEKGEAKPGPGQWGGSPDGKAIAFFRDHQDGWEDAG